MSKVFSNRDEILLALSKQEITVAEAQNAFADLTLNIHVDGKGFVRIGSGTGAMKSGIKVGEFSRIKELMPKIEAVIAKHLEGCLVVGDKKPDTTTETTAETTAETPPAPETAPADATVKPGDKLLGTVVEALEATRKAA